MMAGSLPHFLLVMDDDSDMSHASHILAKYHFCNSQVKLKSSREALRHFTQLTAGGDNPTPLPELILLSLDASQQKEMALISRKTRLADVPLVVIANSREEEDAFRGLNLPLTYCIGKPLGFFKLLEAMQKLGMFWMALRSSPT